MSTFLSYILLGLSLSAPIGPVNAAQLDKGIRFGFWNAWLLGLGAMAADAAFMLVIYFGFAHFLQTPFMKAFLWTFGCFVLIYTGLEGFQKAKTVKASKQAVKEPPLKSFTQGFFLTLSNPISILFWLGIYGSILAQATATTNAAAIVLNTIAIFLGILVWDFTMAAVASTFQKIARSNILMLISRAAGLCLIGFGLYLGFQAFKLLFV